MNALVLAPRARVANEVLVHMLTRLSSTAACEHPFPHFFVEDIFPGQIYQALLDSQPKTEQMLPVAQKHYNSDGTCNRHELVLQPATIDTLAPEHRELWLGVYNALSAPQLKQAVFAKLSAGLSYRFRLPRQQVNKVGGYPRTALMRETRGYSIAPHPDGRRKVVTMQFALPADCSQEDLGTTFYERSFDPRDWLREPRGFRHAKQMPFRPNCAYGFTVLNSIGKKSWHGRETIAREQGTRNSLLHIYYAAEDYSRSGYEG